MKKTDLDELERLVMELRREWDRVEGLDRIGWKVSVTVPVTGETIEYSIPIEKQTEFRESLIKKLGDLAKKITEINWTNIE